MSDTTVVKKQKYQSLEPVVFHTVNTIIMITVIIIMVYPFWNTIAVSFNDAQDSLRGGITLFPRKFSIYSYETVFKNNLMLIAAFNSIMRTLLSTVLGVFVSSLIAFVLSRRELIGKKFIATYFIVTMYVNAGLIPNYFVIRDLNLINNFWVYVIPGIVSAFNVIIIKSFMEGLPDSLTEAAIVDGAGYFRCYIKIVLPCCRPVLATIALWCAVGAWNSWFDTFLYCSSNEELTTLQYEMMKLLSASMNIGRDTSSIFGSKDTLAQTVTPTSIRAAVTVVAAVPILIVYPFLQKYFVKGVTLGAVKG